MNAPKKIWMAADDAFQEYYHQFDGDIPYIRADIVDELVEVLKAFVPLMPPEDAPCHVGIVKQSECGYCQRIAKFHAALARLEESHD